MEIRRRPPNMHGKLKMGDPSGIGLSGVQILDLARAARHVPTEVRIIQGILCMKWTPSLRGSHKIAVSLFRWERPAPEHAAIAFRTGIVLRPEASSPQRNNGDLVDSEQ